MNGGFILYGPGAMNHPWDGGYFSAWIDDPNVKIDYAWTSGESADSLRMIWRAIKSGKCDARDPLLEAPSPGASIFAPVTIPPGESKTIVLHLAWYFPNSNLFEPKYQNGVWTEDMPSAETYRPWYAARFSDINGVIKYWTSQYQSLRKTTERFTRAFYDSTLPPEAIEAVAANLSILKSPTVLRQIDGRLWGWEGTNNSAGSCYGSCTHVWNYAQAIAHLFPNLERSLRETELGPNQDDEGYQVCRGALPIRASRPADHGFPAADGQLGGIIKVYRDWRVCGDTNWLRRLWPRIRASLDYCIKTWDPEGRGWIEEPHPNTYDVEFWGPDSYCTGIYIGALRAATLMGEALNATVDHYANLLSLGVRRMEQDMFNGEYFFQIVEWQSLRAPIPPKDALSKVPPESPRELEASRKEGPRSQYGQGCLADGVMGAWLCFACGVGDILEPRKLKSHLTAVYCHNFKDDLFDHANFGRAIFACGNESGLVMCTWPRGGEPSLPFAYAEEVWTGTEYQVASHLIALGEIGKGLDIVRSCRKRYDGRIRNPFSEEEAGQWYARAMSSYALLQAFSGARFDAVEKCLYLRPTIRGDFRSFLSTATGFGTVGVKNGQPFVEVVSGSIPYTKIEYTIAL
jgi:uncharacterized protein (DUF608 family)